MEENDSGIRSRTVVRYSFYFTKMKKRETIYLLLPVMDADALNQAGQHFYSVLGEDFWERMKQSDNRKISPGLLTIENCAFLPVTAL